MVDLNRSNMWYLKIKFTLFLLLICSCIIAQPTKESVIRIIQNSVNDSITAHAYFDLARLYSRENTSLAISYADTAKMIFQKSKNEEGIHLFDYIKSIILYNSGNYKDALIAGEEYLEWTKKVKNLEREWYAVSTLSNLYRESGDFSKGIEYALRGIQIGLSLHRDDENGYFYNELGNMYATLKQYELSNEYFQKAFDLAKKQSFLGGQAVCLRNIATNYIQLKQLDTAIDMARKSITIDSIQKNELGVSRSLQLVARIYEAQFKTNEAIKEYEKALSKIEKETNANDHVSVLQGLIRNYLALNNIKKAEAYFQKLKRWVSKIEAVDLTSEQLKLQALFHEKQGNIKDALINYKEYVEKNNKELSTDISNQITGLHIQFESKRKEDQISLLSKENELTQIKLNTARNQMVAALIGLGLFSILGYYIFTLWQTTKKQKNLIQKSLSEKETLLREIHHRVKNNLQVISSLLNLQARNVEDATTLAALKEGQNRVKSMALIHQNLYQDENLTGIEINKYFETLISNLFSSYSISPDRIKLLTTIDPIYLDVDTMIPLGLVINELISNSLKYAFPNERTGHISVWVKEDNDHLQVKVQDDGIGILDPEKQISANSFGYRMIKAFAQQLNANLTVENINGTTVTLLLKDYKKAA